jgi:hypothetical protein
MKPPAVTREEHLAWSKKRALEYVERGDLIQAVTSMSSDMNKHPELGINDFLFTSAIMFEVKRGPQAVRRWIEGFN